MKRLLRIIDVVAEEIAKTNVSVFSANAAFFLFLSIFPGLMLLISVTQYTIISFEGIMALVYQLVPDALTPLLEYILEDLSALNPAGVLSISTIALLWSASKGVYGLVRGLNLAFHQEETRSFIRVRLFCLIYTVGVLLSLVVVVTLYTLTTSFLNRTLPAGSLILKLLSTLVHYRWLVSGILLFGLFTAIYTFFPCRQNKIKQILPGSILATVGWLIFTSLYSKYILFIGGTSSIYGGISIVAFAMLWLYFCMNIFFYSAMFSYYLTQKRQQIKGLLGWEKK